MDFALHFEKEGSKYVQYKRAHLSAEAEYEAQVAESKLQAIYVSRKRYSCSYEPVGSTGQCYFSFEIHFSFSFYKFFHRSILFLYYISIS